MSLGVHFALSAADCRKLRALDDPEARQELISEDLEEKYLASEWQEHYLASRTVFDLHLAGVVATGSHCYALKPHPALGGPDPLKGHAVPPDRAMVMPFWMWQSFCRQSLGGPA